MLTRSVTRWLALAIALAGCGRLGFRDVAPGPDGDAAVDGPGGSGATVVVTSDEYLSEPAGRPIAGATVLVERGAATDRLVIGADGTVQFNPTGATMVHAIYKSDVGWRGYTVALPNSSAAPGTRIELGSRPASNPNHTITFALPNDATATDYTVRVPTHCAFPPQSASPSVTTSFDAGCDGQAVRALGFTFTSAGAADQYLDAGMVTLSDGATRTMTGSYAALPQRTLQLTNLPASSDSATAQIVARDGLELTSLTPAPDSQLTSGNAAVTLHMAVAPGGNAIDLSAFSVTPVQFQFASERIAPTMAVSTGPAGAFDAKDMLPMFTALTLTDPAKVAWTGGDGGTITIVERTAGGVQWDWYLPATATVALLPAIPADLGVPAPKSPDFAEVVKLAVPDTTADQLLPTIDRRWPSWPHDSALLPQAGSSESRAFYTAALGPP